MTRTGRRFSILFAAIAALAKTGSAAARREFLRSARVLAAVALIALVAALALPGAAQAQSVTTLVSNTGQLDSTFSANAIGAQPFTTGSAAVLTSVDVYLGANGGLGVEDIRVRILQDDSGSPGTELVTLPYLTAKIDNAVNTFTAPADTNLAAGRTYYVEVSKNGDDGVHWFATQSHLEDDGGATGWEISDTLHYKNAAEAPSWSTLSTAVLIIAIKGTAAGDTPTPSTDATLSDLVVNDGSADLTLTPTFASGTATYTASVANAVDEVTVTPTTTDTNATPEFLNASDATLADADGVANGHQVALAVGDTVFKVQVTAEDGTTTETYTVTVNRAAQAQTTTTFVSNTGESRGSAPRSIMAQSFTAGSNPDGYTLSDVALIYFSEPSGADFTVTRVKIRRDNAGAPGDLVANLLNPASFSAGILSFAAPANTTLHTGETYWVVLNEGYDSASDRLRFYTTSSDDQTVTTADPNWSIADTRLWKNMDAVNWVPPSSTVVMLAVNATIPASTDATLSALSLGTGVTLDPTFVSGTTSYTAAVANSVDEVTVTATLGDSGATIEYLDGDDATLDDADTAKDDFQVAVAEGDNVIKVKVTAEDDTTTQTYTVTVTRAAADTPTVTIAADQPAFTGRLDWVTFTLTRTGDPAAALDVAVALTQDQDLLASGDLAQTVTFGAGNAGATLTLFPFVSFQTVTQETTLTATVEAGTGYSPGSPDTASTRIVAADPAVTASIEEAAHTFAEDATDATVAVILRTATGVPSPNTDILVVLSTEEIPGQAVSNVDYTHFARFLKFQPSDFTSDGAAFTARQEVTLAIVDDLFEEPDETVTLALEPSPGTPEVVALRQADGTACRSSIRCDVTVTITDNDPSTDATLSGLSLGTGVTLDPAFAPGTLTYTAAVGNAVDEVTVTATTTDTNATPEFLNASDTALDDADDVANGHQVALAEGDTVFKVQVTAEDTTTTETYTVTVTRAAADTPTVTIAADQPAFVARLDWVTFTLTRTGDAAAALDVAVALTQDQDLLASGNLAQTVTFGAGNATATLTLFPDVFQTVTQETTLTATVEAGTGYAPGSPNTASTRMVVTDPAVTVWIEQTAYTFAEDATIAVIARTATGVPSPNTEINVSLGLKNIPGQAVGGVDYTGFSLTLRIQPSDFTSDGAVFTARQDVPLAIVDDALYEPDETLTLALERSPGTPEVVALRQADSTACQTSERCDVTVTITDNDGPTVTIAADQPAFTARLDNVTFTLTRTGDAAAALDVAVALTQDQDLLESATLAQTVTFGAGDATATLTLSPVPFEGHTVTQETTLTATVQAGTGYAPGSPNTASTRMVVTDPAVTVWIEETAYTFAEDAADATVAVIARTATGVPSPNLEFFVAFNTVAGQAAGGVDHTSFSLSLKFQPSDFTSDGAVFTARQEVTLAIVDDLFDEPDETLTLSLQQSALTPLVVAFRQPDGTACRTSNRCDVTVTITDNDPSTDATLSGLSLGTGVTLDPAFASATETYTASVGNSVDEVTVTSTTTDTNATPEFLDASDATLADADGVPANGQQVALAVGDTVFKVQVTAEDGTTTKTYTVTVTRDDFPHDTTTTTTGAVEVGGSVTGTGGTLDRDWFRVVLEAGTRYQIDVEGADTGRGTMENPAASMFDAVGTSSQSR